MTNPYSQFGLIAKELARTRFQLRHTRDQLKEVAEEHDELAEPSEEESPGLAMCRSILNSGISIRDCYADDTVRCYRGFDYQCARHGVVHGDDPE